MKWNRHGIKQTVALVMLVISLALTTVPALASITSLRPGDEGTAVELLQEALRKKGFYTYPQITGYYGAETEIAVRQFQQSVSLARDGIAGKVTLKTLLGKSMETTLAGASLVGGSPTLAKAALTEETKADTVTPKASANTASAALPTDLTKSPNPSSSSTASGRAAQAIAIAKQFLGAKYVYATAGPTTFDCSGLTLYVFKQLGFDLPHTTRLQCQMGSSVSFQNLQMGDLVFFDTVAGNGLQYDHVGIYIADGQFIHAASGGTGRVTISSITSGYYRNTYSGARRLL
ncbi:hypothetical protein AGMMS49992_00770 [Clostridia bacterium]|nr:hypothetical protein AGMMS49992_00770 [Clostridia bacterium]